jgi:tetratricopeptide (TPR) repeat protein
MLVIDPLKPVSRYNYAERLSLTGRVEEAHELADLLLAQSPGWGYAAHARTSLIWEGKIAEGLIWGLQGLRESGNSAWAWAVFTWVGEYDEARRFSGFDHVLALYEGRFDEAIQATQRNLYLNPNNERVIRDAALFLYVAGRIDEALPLYERLREFVPEGRLIPGQFPVVQTMRLAQARRRAGDEEGAQAAAQIAKQDHAARRAAGRKSQEQDLAEAALAAFEGDPDRAITALESAIQRGLRIHWFLDDTIFEDLWNEPLFIALQQELDAILAEEHDKVLQLICFNNPVPDNWQPMPETCEGVEEQNEL